MSGAVVITGASTGIGRASALRLARSGFDVYAGVRKEADAERLRSDGVTPLMVDITDETSIAAARERVAVDVGERGLAGLVNNAGAAFPGPIEYIPLDDLRRQFEVNTIGQVAVTQAFLPLVRRATGRVVFIGSVGGRVALPFIGPYAGSKSAVSSLADSLRQELARWGIWVAVVEPGNVATPIWDKGDRGTREAIEKLPPEGRERYAGALESGTDTAVKMGRKGADPDKVARVVEHALTARRPRARYLVGADAYAQVALSRLLPERLFGRLVARQMGL
jgi:NAD(P)-dependent dehydrogenase (short-subunit alcohol dehydrogenase family)